MNVRRYFWAAALVALLGGCNKGGAPADPAAALTGDSPEAALKGIIEAGTSGDASVAWTILTPKQQADVKTVLQETAAKVDADVWARGFGVLAKLGEVLKAKKDYILGSSVIPNLKPEDKEELARSWPQIVEIVDALANSEIKTIDGLKTVDPGQFFATTGSKVLTGFTKLVEGSSPTMAADLKAMKSAKVSLVGREGDAATVKIEAEGVPADEVKLKKVDGKWQPLGLIDDWDGGINGARKGLDGAKMTPEQKQQVLGMIAMAEGALDKLLAAKDQTEFDAALTPVLMAAQFLQSQFGSAPSPSGPTGLGGPSQTGPGTLPAPGTLPTPSGTVTPPSAVGPSLPGPTLPGNPNVPAINAPTGVLPSGGPTLPAARSRTEQHARKPRRPLH
ncbi:MAG: hypothetical protein QM775_33360 [Pirellulales bacterium]